MKLKYVLLICFYFRIVESYRFQTKISIILKIPKNVKRIENGRNFFVKYLLNV